MKPYLSLLYFITLLLQQHHNPSCFYAFSFHRDKKPESPMVSILDPFFARFPLLALMRCTQHVTLCKFKVYNHDDLTHDPTCHN